VRQVITVVAGVLVLVVLYWRIDLARMLHVFAAADLLWLAGAFALHIPMVVLAAERLRRMVQAGSGISVAEALRLNLAAASLNVVLPSKMGDLAKSWFFQRRGHLTGSQGFALVIFERACDLLSLLLWCGAGLATLPAREPLIDALSLIILFGVLGSVTLLVSRGFAAFCFALAARLCPRRGRERLHRLEESWREMQDYFLADRVRAAVLVALSLAIWFVNLFQVWMFLRALKAPVPVMASMGLAPLAILVGLLPVTFAGVGTRDVAVIYFFRDYMDPPAGAALGLLLTVRYLLFGVAGLPFLGVVSRSRPDGQLS